MILLGSNYTIRTSPKALIKSSAEEKQTVIAKTSHQMLILEVGAFNIQAKKSTP